MSLDVRAARRARLHPVYPALHSTTLSGHIHMLLDEVSADEDELTGGGAISPSAYETAWVAMVRDPRHPDALAFPASLVWLLSEQHADGSWDGPFPHSIVPTMAALLALRRAPRQTAAVDVAGRRAEGYLRRAVRRWRRDALDLEMLDTPFFEFLVPVLAAGLAQVGTPLDVPDLAVMQRRRAEKLARVPLDLLYAGRSNLVHALEALGPDLDFEQVRRLRAPTGGYGYSPSATAAVLLYAPTWDEAAERWLRGLSGKALGGTPGAMPTSHPADTFEAAWVLHLLLHGGVPLDGATSSALRRSLRWLRACLRPEGASFARDHALPADVDDTALTLAVLNRLGVQTALDPLWGFEREDHFVSYAGERTSSTSANAHTLQALLSVDALGLPPLAARREKIVRYLLRARAAEGYWLDKWHLSPYYATLSCVLALARMPDPALHRELLPTLAWLRGTQRRGGWGMSQPTQEETAYALLSLRALLRILPDEYAAAYDTDDAMLQRGRRFLLRRLGGRGAPERPQRAATLPTLWADKALYAPPRVIRAAVLAALYASSSSPPGPRTPSL